MSGDVLEFPNPSRDERKRIWEGAFEALMLTGLSELEVARIRVELALNWFVVTFPPGTDRDQELDAFAAMIAERRDMVVDKR